MEIAKVARPMNASESNTYITQECGDDRELRDQVNLLMQQSIDNPRQHIDASPTKHDRGSARTSTQTQVLGGALAERHERAVAILALVGHSSDDRVKEILDRECGADVELRAIVDELLGHDPNSNDQFGRDANDGTPVPSLIARLKNQNLGDYELIEEIGRGGMGFVFRARQVSLDRIVAIKILRSSGVTGEALARFRLEAGAVAILDHPNIVPIYEIGEVNDVVFFSMKLIDGGSLETVIQDDSRDLRDAVRMMAVVARAVHHSHQNGILHRDLKPANILVDREGLPYITDFGIAKRLEADASETQTGQILGTPAYLSPEQAEAGTAPLTTATDVYGLGAILYELITGCRVVESNSLVDAITVITQFEPKSPRSHNPKIDRDLQNICLKCLRKAPRERYASADSLANDLERWLRQEPVVARPLRSHQRLVKWCRRRPMVAALWGVLTMMTITSVVLIAWKWQDAEQQRDAALEAQQEAEVATQLAERQQQLAIVESETSLEVSRFLQGLLEEGDPIAWGGRMFGQSDADSSSGRTIRDILESGTQQLDQSFEQNPRVRANLLEVFGSAWLGLGETDEARRLFTESEVLIRDNYPEAHPKRIALVHNQARVMLAEGRSLDAEEAFRKALAAYSSIALDKEDLANRRRIETALADVEFDLAVAILTSGTQRADVAREFFEDSLERRELLYGESGRPVLWSVVGVAMSHLEEGQNHSEALSYLARAIELLGESKESSALNNAIGYFAQAKILHQAGFFDRAETAYLNTIDVLAPLLGDQHFVTLTVRRQLAHFYFWSMDDHARSEEQWRLVHAGYLAHSKGHTPQLTADSLLNLARCRRDAGALDEAVVLIDESIDARLKYLDATTSGFPRCLIVARDIAERRLEESNDAEDAYKLLERLIDVSQKPQLSEIESVCSTRYWTYLALGEYTISTDRDAAREWLLKARGVAVELQRFQATPDEENRKLERVDALLKQFESS